jgi:hypothetical protein
MSCTNKYETFNPRFQVNDRYYLRAQRNTVINGVPGSPVALPYEVIVQAFNITTLNNTNNGNYNPTTGIFYCPVDGFLNIHASCVGNNGFIGFQLLIFQNGVPVMGTTAQDSPRTQTVKYATISATIRVNEKDEIQIRGVISNLETGGTQFLTSSTISLNTLILYYNR